MTWPSGQLEAASGSEHAVDTWSWQDFADGLGRGRRIGPETRQTRFDRLEQLAADGGIDVHVCTCKNPHLAAGANCRIAGPPLESQLGRDASLFPIT